ncbi:MAG TPA: hypothetical protein VEB59_14415 [Gemmatimonadales bacterium]|nr:hypothetical protein [Gemmatimonadales bacterium]
MSRVRMLLVAVALILGSASLWAQDSAVTVAAGPQYDTGWLHRLLFGTHYRDLWTTPIRAQVLDLERFAGGLTATRKGGGQQTRSLRFKGADGREYQFRSIDKDPTPALPPALRQSVVRNIIRDQTSAGHPAAALVVPPLLQSVGVLAIEPRIVVLPEDDPRLGEFAAEFGGLLGTIEERPREGNGAEGFAGATDVIDSDKLFKKIEDSPDDRVDARTFLAARLVDLFVGDWDRHRDQWRWARFGDETPRIWQGIPRDRDQAFARYDGVLLTVARSSAPQFVNFGDDYPGMLGLTWNGRELDRWFLSGLERPVWDSIALALQEKLTDEAIERAVAQLPAAYHALDSARLARALKHRRDRLPQAALDFYRHLAGEVEVHGTDKSDLAAVERIDGRVAEVTIALRGEEGVGEPYYRRRFDARETKEVRLHLHAGDDEVVVRGAGDGGVRVRVLPGTGTDAVADSAAGGAVHLYTTDEADRVLPGGDVAVSRKPYEPADTAIRDWGTRWLTQIWVSGGPDVGVFGGTGLSYTRYGFRQDPYASRYVLRAGWATQAATGRAELSADWRRPNSRVHYGFLARASGIEVLRFHGFGNETEITDDDEFYRVNQRDLSLAPFVSVPVAGRTDLRLGPILRYSDTDFDEPRFISLTQPYGSGSFSMLGATADLRLDARNRPNATTHGGFIDVGASVYPAVLEVEEAFGSVYAVAGTYLTVDSMPLQPTLALRAGGKHVWGDFPFQESAFIGDAASVRLGRQNRYAGESAVYGNAELRLRLGAFNVLVPGELGIFGLGDVGRVYLEGEESDTWHGAYGGGLWLSFIERVNTISVAIAKSEERTGVYVGAGFGF